MAIELPIDGDELTPNYRVGTTVDQVQLLFDVRWNAEANDRAGAWFMDILDANADPIVEGIKIVLGVLLARRVTDSRLPPGGFVARDLSGAGREATIGDLGTRVKIYHYTAAELAAT